MKMELFIPKMSYELTAWFEKTREYIVKNFSENVEVEGKTQLVPTEFGKKLFTYFLLTYKNRCLMFNAMLSEINGHGWNVELTSGKVINGSEEKKGFTEAGMKERKDIRDIFVYVLGAKHSCYVDDRADILGFSFCRKIASEVDLGSIIQDGDEIKAVDAYYKLITIFSNGKVFKHVYANGEAEIYDERG